MANSLLRLFSVAVFLSMLNVTVQEDRERPKDISISHDDLKKQVLRFVSRMPRVKTVSYGQSLTLRCQAIGKPTPFIHWFYNKKPFLPKVIPASEKKLTNETTQMTVDNFSYGSTKSSLKIDCMTEENVGKYTCVAVSGPKYIYQSAQINLENNEPSFLDWMEHCNNHPTPNIYVWTGELLTIIGNTVELMCRISNPDDSTIMDWVRLRASDGLEETIEFGDKFAMNDSGSLVIKSISKKDEGIYVCYSANRNGYDSVQSYVKPVPYKGS